MSNDNISCPVCKSKYIKDTSTYANNNGYIGNYREWKTSDTRACLSCGVMFIPTSGNGKEPTIYVIKQYEKFNNEKGEIIAVHMEHNNCQDIQVGDTVHLDVGKYKVLELNFTTAFNGGVGQNVHMLIKLLTIYD